MADPHFRWNLASVTHHAQLSEEDDVLEGNVLSYKTWYEYQNGNYDRTERAFLGYGEVRQIEADGSKIVSTYKNDSIFTEGLLEKQEVYDSDGNLLSRQENEYSLSYQGTPRHIIYSGSQRDFRWGLSQLVREISESWEAGSRDVLRMERRYEYDDYGNLTSYGEDLPGDDGDLTLSIAYKYMRTIYRVSLPERLEVRDFDNRLLRRREGTYDSLGRMTALEVFYDSTSSISRISWNDDGTLASVTDPLGAIISYTYDDSGLFVEQIDSTSSDRQVISSHMTWNRAEGTLGSRIDPNGLIERHVYDGFGRLLEMYSPYDTRIPAVSYEYIKDNRNVFLYARTANKVSTDPDDDERIYTLIKIDGLGRPIYTAKSGFIAHTGLGGGDSRWNAGGELGWNVSGAAGYDEKGRAVKQGRPGFQAGDKDSYPSAPLLEEDFITETVYDDLDRPIRTIYPSENWGDVVSTYEYRIDGGRSLVIATDPLGRVTETYKNARGGIEKLLKKYSGETLANVRYGYSPLGELLEVVQLNPGEPDYSINFTYDMRGLQVTQESPETGLINYWYDRRGNLIARDDANLRAMGKMVRNHYDGFGRISRTEYPKSEDVRYFYGDEWRGGFLRHFIGPMQRGLEYWGM